MAGAESRHSQDQEPSQMEKTSEKREPSLSDSSSTAGSVNVVSNHDEKQKSLGEAARPSSPHHMHHGGLGTPDIDHDEAEGAVPGHDLDVELAQVSHIPPQHHHNQHHH